MTRISSRWTRFHKWVFPIFWFGFLAVFIATAALEERRGPDPMIFIMPVVMAVFGFFVMKKLVWNLADDVYDCGDELLVRRGGREERVKLSNVMNVSISSNTNPARITLRLDQPGRFGNEIAFTPAAEPFTFTPFAKSKVGEDLIVRVDRARVERTR